MIDMQLNSDLSEKALYDYNDYPVYARKGRLSDYPDYTALAHWHDDIELMYVLSGSLDYNVDGVIVNLSEKNGIFVNSKRVHYGFSEEKNECEFICVKLHPLLLCINAAFEKDYILPILNNSDIPFLKMDSSVDWQIKILTLVEEIYLIKNDFNAPIKIESIFWRLWEILFENIAPIKNESFQSSEISALKNMISYVQNNYAEKITLAQIARSAAVGKSKCCKMFASLTFKTPITYLNDYRLQKSVELLCGTDMTVSEVAFSVGFGGSSYFTETFHKKYGCTPSEYRVNNKKSKF